MFRRVVSLLLLPCVLLTQSAVYGHSHGEDQPAGHDLRPHFHTNPLSTAPEHGHHHGPGGHRHEDEEDDDAPPPEEQTPHDHDSDAVFVTSIDVVLDQRSAAEDVNAASPPWGAAELTPVAAIGDSSPAVPADRTHPPPEIGYHCALFLRHLALLI
jgi:hypothetical protein